MSASKDYSYGTPSLEEWDRLWKRSPHDPDVSNDEYKQVTDRLYTLLNDIGKVGYLTGCEFYLRGDNYGDRTQYVEIVDPNVLNARFLESLQSFLRMPEFQQWRFLVMTDLGKSECIVVYPSTIRLGSRYESNLEKALNDIVERLRKKREKKVRLRTRKHSL